VWRDYAETLPRPAERESALLTGVAAVGLVGIEPDGFAPATARAHDATVAS
jgi:hypothetical protein